jgi:hypothetical protein
MRTKIKFPLQLLKYIPSSNSTPVHSDIKSGGRNSSIALYRVWQKYLTVKWAPRSPDLSELNFILEAILMAEAHETRPAHQHVFDLKQVTLQCN